MKVVEKRNIAQNLMLNLVQYYAILKAQERSVILCLTLNRFLN